MKPFAFEHAGARLLACEGELAAPGDALEFVSASCEHDAHGIVLEAAQLPPAFVDLRTRFAGEFIQKLQNYQLRTALVLADAGAGDPGHGERFREFLLEARTGKVFRVFDLRAHALDWLARTLP
jgi:hypothetical protein